MPRKNLSREPEKPLREFQFSYILDGQHWQMRHGRADAAYKAAFKAESALFSDHRELVNRGEGPSDEERERVRIMAKALAYVRWWPLDVALQLAVAEETGMHGGTRVTPEHARARLLWLNKPKKV